MTLAEVFAREERDAVPLARYVLDESDYMYPTLRRADDETGALPFLEAKAALVAMLKDRVQHWRDALADARNMKERS